MGDPGSYLSAQPGNIDDWQLDWRLRVQEAVQELKRFILPSI